MEAYQFLMDNPDYITGDNIKPDDMTVAGLYMDALNKAEGIGSQTVKNFSDNYNLSEDIYNNHILYKHGANNNHGVRSSFNADFDIKNSRIFLSRTS